MNKSNFNEAKDIKTYKSKIFNRRNNTFIGVVTGIALIFSVSVSNALGFFGHSDNVELSAVDSKEITTEEEITGTTSSVTTTSLTMTTSRSTMTETTTTTTTTAVETTSEVLEVAETTVAVVETPVVETVAVVESSNNDEANVTAEYIVYKPSSHYVHKSTCRWYDNTCYEITSTEGLEARKCSECNPDIDIVTEYVEPVPEVQTVDIGDYTMSYVKYFSRGTYYPVAGNVCGGSGRTLIDCSWGDGTVKGSIASSYLYNNYGYNYNSKRTMVYLEIAGYESMNGLYYLDDCDAGNPNVIDFYYQSSGNCIFSRAGVVGVDCYIVNY